MQGESRRGKSAKGPMPEIPKTPRPYDCNDMTFIADDEGGIVMVPNGHCYICRQPQS